MLSQSNGRKRHQRPTTQSGQSLDGGECTGGLSGKLSCRCKVDAGTVEFGTNAIL